MPAPLPEDLRELYLELVLRLQQACEPPGRPGFELTMCRLMCRELGLTMPKVRRRSTTAAADDAGQLRRASRKPNGRTRS